MRSPDSSISRRRRWHGACCSCPSLTLRTPLLALFLIARAAAADSSAAERRPHLRATHVDRPPLLDGVVGAEEWSAVPATDAFTQKFPAEGHPPTEKTLLRVGYDQQALYVAIECEQRLAPVEARLTRRDRQVEADWVAVILDTRRDGRSAFVFNVNAAGVLTDLLRFDDTDISAEWDDNWEARTARTESGWSAELRIPLRILRFESAHSTCGATGSPRVGPLASPRTTEVAISPTYPLSPSARLTRSTLKVDRGSATRRSRLPSASCTSTVLRPVMADSRPTCQAPVLPVALAAPSHRRAGRGRVRRGRCGGCRGAPVRAWPARCPSTGSSTASRG